jgi:hypothetical protein
MAIIGLLFVFWCFMAYQAFMAGNPQKAAVYVAVGVGLTAYRMSKLKQGA